MVHAGPFDPELLKLLQSAASTLSSSPPRSINTTPRRRSDSPHTAPQPSVKMPAPIVANFACPLSVCQSTSSYHRLDITVVFFLPALSRVITSSISDFLLFPAPASPPLAVC